MFSELSSCLAQLGLVTEGSKCKLLVVRASPKSNPEPVPDGLLAGATPDVVSELRFLGLKISTDGSISRWKTDFDKALWTLYMRLRDTGLGCYPHALVKAYSIFLQPAALFGIEVWGAQELLRVCKGTKSPYTNEY